MHTDSVRRIAAAETYPLRGAVLRPGQAPEKLSYPHDDAPTTFHAGVWIDALLVGIATVSQEPAPGEHDLAAWRLRGMAVDPAMQRRGIGRQLIEACIVHVKAHAGTSIWCNGRSSAADFYRSFGFVLLGPAFDLPDSGPHYRMRLAL